MAIVEVAYGAIVRLRSVKRSAGRVVILIAAVGLAVTTPALAQSEDDTEPLGWVSPAGPGGVFPTAYEACEAQWDRYMNNGYSRFMGIKRTSDDFRFMACEWTRYQYLCPEETGGGFKCGTIIPANVQIVCPDGYLASIDGYCRLRAALERPCDDECSIGGNDGRTNPSVGNPVVLATGAKRIRATDYSTADGLFRIVREYRSYQVGRPFQQRVLPRSLPRGLDGYWNFDFNYELQFGVFDGSPSAPNATVAILLPDGTGYSFKLQDNGTWIENPNSGDGNASQNLRLELVNPLPSDIGTLRDTSTTWRLTDRNDTVWTIETRTGPNGCHYLFGWPVSMATRSGYSQTFTYGSDGELASITDSFGRSARFAWEMTNVTTLANATIGRFPVPARVSSIDLPDGTSLSYDYEEARLPRNGTLFSSNKWSNTWGGGTKPGGSHAVISELLPMPRRLISVDRLSAADDVLDSVTYLHENDRYARNVTGIVDHRGERVATYVYDSAGRVVATEGAEGAKARAIQYGNSGSSRIRDVTNEYGKHESDTFSEFSAGDRDYRLTEISGTPTANTEAASATIAYGANTYVSSVTDAEGRLITTARDARGRQVSITEASGTADGRTTTIAWHATFNVPETIVAPGLTEVRSYDAQGRLSSVTLTDTASQSAPYSTIGQTRTYTYAWDGNGRLLSENGPLAASGSADDLTSYTYDTSGNLLTATNAMGHVNSFAGHDANGRPGTMTDPNGVVTSFAYDPLGRVETITVEHPTDATLNATTAMEYDSFGSVTKLTLPDTAPLIMEYDAANRLIAMRSAAGEHWSYTYDAGGNVERETVTRTDGSTYLLVRRQFDELGRLLRETLGTRSPASWGYDKVNNVVAVTDPNGFATTTSFDALDRVISTIAPDGGTTGATYDEQDNALTFTDPISVTTDFSYNGFGEVIEEVSPDRGTNTYWYDAAGRVSQSSDGRGQVVNYTYDWIGRVTQMTPVGRPASEIIEYHYDSGGLSGSYGIGRLAKVIDGSGTTLFGYDHRGNQIAQQQVIGTSTAAQLAYEYDAADRVTQITYPSGRQVRYGYDIEGRVTLVETRENASVSVWEVVASGHQYEPFGPIKSMALGNGLSVANEWGLDGRLAARRLFTTIGGTNVSHLAYGRDAVGRIGAIADLVSPPNSIYYGYDEVGRLTMAVSEGSSGNSESYTYTSGTNQLASLTDSSGTRTITYDGRGNTVGENRSGGIAVTATYDGYGRLASYDRSNIGAQTYSYNGMGDRVRVDKPTGTRYFVYDTDGRVIGEYGTSASDVKAEFIWALPPGASSGSPFGGGDEIMGYAPLALVTENGSSQLELYWVHGNHLGVPLVTTNASGQVVTPGSDFLRPGFPGQSQVLSDLYYNRARDYDPLTGRYIQADPIGLWGGSNPYLYADADPVNLIDPLGLFQAPAAPNPLLIRVAPQAAIFYGISLTLALLWHQPDLGGSK